MNSAIFKLSSMTLYTTPAGDQVGFRAADGWMRVFSPRSFVCVRGCSFKVKVARLISDSGVYYAFALIPSSVEVIPECHFAGRFELSTVAFEPGLKLLGIELSVFNRVSRPEESTVRSSSLLSSICIPSSVEMLTSPVSAGARRFRVSRSPRVPE